MVEEIEDISKWGSEIEPPTEGKTGFPVGLFDDLARSLQPVRSFGIRKKKCTKKPCGDSCIAMSKACLKDLSPEQRKLAIKARNAMKKGEVGPSSEIPTDLTPNASGKDKIDPALHNFYDFATGNGGLTLEEDNEVLGLLGLDGQDGKGLAPWQQKKADKLQKDELTYVESVAFEGYIGQDYQGMNEVLYNTAGFQDGETNINGFTFEEQMLINKAAASGMKKLPSVTTEQIEEIKHKGGGGWKEGDPFVRHESLSGDVLEAQINKHKSALESGEAIVKEQFFSTTFAQEGLDTFSEGANVEYKIKGKVDGTGSGKLVDKYKNKAFESEVLYPPMSQFRVTSVTENPATAAVFEDVETVTYKTSKGKASKIVLDVLEYAEFQDYLGAGGFNKTSISKKINEKVSSSENMAKWTPGSNKSKALLSQAKELKKLSQSIKNTKGGKKGLKEQIQSIKASLKKSSTEVKIQQVLVTPSKAATFTIELEEL